MAISAMKTMKKTLKIAGITCFILLIGYALLCTFLWARQGYYIFMPRKEIKKTPAAYQLAYEDVYLSIESPHGRKERIHAWWIPAPGPSDKTLLYLHGSALNIGANVDHVRRFHNLGFAVFIISYRGYGLSDGQFPTEAQVYADAEAAWKYLVGPSDIDPGRIFIYGHSIGGAVAIELATHHPNAAGLIVEATFTSIVDVARLDNKYRVFPLDLIVHERFDSLQKVADLRMPVLFIHGTNDHLIPFEMSRRLYENTSSPKRLKFVTGGGHNNSAAVGGKDYLRSIRNFEEFVSQEPRLRPIGKK